jgi:hypothetical protein
MEQSKGMEYESQKASSDVLKRRNIKNNNFMLQTKFHIYLHNVHSVA